MDEEKQKTRIAISKKEILNQSGVNFFRIFDAYRKEKGISIRNLVQGVMSSRAFLNIQKGRNVLSWDDWNLFMQRMGVVTDYFEAIVSRKELEDWRRRENICLLVWEEPAEAAKLLEEYQEIKQREKNEMPKVQKQFCMKIKWLLSRSDLSAQELYNLSCNAVGCTVDEQWQENLEKLYLAPAELDAILLAVWSLFSMGRREEALKLYLKVKSYPDCHGWEPRMQQMICPQTAWVGMKLYQEIHMNEAAYKLGECALELLRNQNSQRYAYPIMKELIQIGMDLKGEGKDLKQLREFKDAFETVYRDNQLPCMRMWQYSSIKNSYDVSLVLKRMRSSLEKTQSEICTDENGFPFLSIKQLSRIEKGENKPTGEVFRFLTKKMERKLDWVMPMLEVDSVKVLSLRQDIMYFGGISRWEKAEEYLEQIKSLIGESDCRKPHIQQEILFIQTVLRHETDSIPIEKAQEQYYEALSYTFPVADLLRKELPFIRREEGMIISNIANLYREMGKTDKAQELFEKLYAVFRPQQQRFKINSPACAVMLGQYSTLLGDLAEYEKAIEIDKINLQYELNDYEFVSIENLLYNQAWAHYEIDRVKKQKQYQKEFLCAQQFTRYNKKIILEKMLEERTDKYLK